MAQEDRLKKLETFLSHAPKFTFGLLEDGRPQSYYYFEVTRCRQGGYKADWLGLYFISKKGKMIPREDARSDQTLVFDTVEEAIEAAIKAFRSLTSPDTDIITFFTLRAEDTLRFFQKLDELSCIIDVEPSRVTRESLLEAFQVFAKERLPSKEEKTEQ